MSSSLVACLCAAVLLAVVVPAGARDGSAPPPATVAAESSRPTTANGSIIKLEPMELPLAAPVLGEEVRTSDAEVMQEIVLTRLLDRYAEERQAAGDVKIHEKALEDACWRYFTDERLHSFCRPGSKEEAQAFATPPWERKAAAE